MFFFFSMWFYNISLSMPRSVIMLAPPNIEMNFIFVEFIDKIHKNDNSFLIIPTLSSKSYFCQHYCVFLEPAEAKEFRDSCSWNLSKCKMFSPANQIARNKHNDEELELLLHGDKELTHFIRAFSIRLLVNQGVFFVASLTNLPCSSMNNLDRWGLNPLVAETVPFVLLFDW